MADAKVVNLTEEINPANADFLYLVKAAGGDRKVQMGNLLVGIDDNATATALTIDASENVSIDDGQFTLGNGASQSYIFDNRGNNLTLYGSSAATLSQLEIFALDADNTDNVLLSIYGLRDSPTVVTNSERLGMGFVQSSTRYEIFSVALGTGTSRPLAIYTGANTSQIVLATDGNVGFGKSPSEQVDINLPTADLGFVDADTTTDPSTAAGYIQVSIGGTTRYIQLYSGAPA